LLTIYHQDNSAAKNYKITLQSYMWHLQGLLQLKKITCHLVLLVQTEIWEKKESENHPKPDQKHAITLLYMYKKRISL